MKLNQAILILSALFLLCKVSADETNGSVSYEKQLLTSILADADANKDNPDLRKKYLNEFLTRSSAMNDLLNQTNIWILRAAAAIELDDAAAGWQAGKKLKNFGSANSDNPAAIKVFIALDRKGWLSDTEPSQANASGVASLPEDEILKMNLDETLTYIAIKLNGVLQIQKPSDTDPRTYRNEYSAKVVAGQIEITSTNYTDDQFISTNITRIDVSLLYPEGVVACKNLPPNGWSDVRCFRTNNPYVAKYCLEVRDDSDASLVAAAVFQAIYLTNGKTPPAPKNALPQLFTPVDENATVSRRAN